MYGAGIEVSKGLAQTTGEAARRIFVVEDEAIVCEDISRTLKRLGYDVAGIARAGVEVLLGVESTQPDLVLMDIKLAGRLDGIQTTAAIRKRWSIPVIYLTSHSDEATLSRAKETSPHGYILKPFNERDLRSSIEVALRKHELEQSLDRRERWFSTTLDSVGDAVIATDAQERVTFMNPVAEKVTGWTREEAHLKPIHEVFRVVTAKGERIETTISTAIRGGFRAELPLGARILDRIGESKEVDDSIAPIVDAHGNVLGSVVVFRDITDKRRLEERLALSERLASIATMAAGVAHELNNPLAAASANVEFASHRVTELQADVELLDVPEWLTQKLVATQQALTDAAKAASHLRKIIADLKKFSRAGEARREFLDLPQVLDSALKMSRHLAGPDTSISLTLGTTPLVDANEGRLVQVFANLIANAIEARSPKVGSLGLVHRVEITTSVDDEGRAIVDVRDSGNGMSSETQRRIFEPFFSTKGTGAGLGLGLSISMNTIEELGGRIAVQSEVGRGTTFRVCLPQAMGSAKKRPLPSTAPPPGRRGRVLVIDDEETVRHSIVRLLNDRHDVVEERDPHLALFRLANGERFDVILCDMSMPTLTGLEVLDAIEKIDEKLSLRVVFLTGGLKPEQAEVLLRKTNAVLEKPFSMNALLAAVARHVARDGSSN